ncbi:MAG TPA: tripartite tricarboxylate transporter substrate binding protein [Falsiroseomonas sp.]|jgi:tripartite-type tricarboxylate transporter receptor subunit TctC|nr:tripartite tricarboxylate transporter substrate binding protein [Falsiroseomonas sp.]
MNRRQILGTAAAAMAGLAGPAAAQAGFHTRPLRIVVPFSAGGSTDILARICAQLLTERLGQSVVAENITGAGGTIGAQRVLEAPADGYTLLAGTPGPITINPQLRSVAYQPLRDFEPVAFLGGSPAVVIVRKDSPIRSMRELIAQAKASPGRLSYASAGVGSFAHLSAELLKWRAGIDLTHVPYRGTAPAATDLLGGRVDSMVENYPSVQAYIASGDARVLAIGTARRSTLLPEVPTVAEEGVGNYESFSWFGLLMRAGTPAAAIAAVNGAINQEVRSPELGQRLAQLGVEPVGGTPAAFRAFLEAKTAETGELIRTASITVE